MTLAPDAIDVDPGARLARVGGEVTWAELDAATQQHGLAITGARLSRATVAGTVLRGDGGWLERSLGPACAHLVAAEVELTDGRIVEADGELLWALRGGGEGFGRVTELRLRLHPVGPVLLCGFLGFARGRAAEVARAYRDLMAGAPDEVGGVATAPDEVGSALVLFAGGAGALNVAYCFAGGIEDGERAVAPLRGLEPALDALAPNEYRAFQAMTDAQNPPGMRSRAHAGFLEELTDEVIDAAVGAANRAAPALSRVALTPLGGALGRLDPQETALRLPDAAWAWECTAMWPPVDSLDRLGVAWADGVRDALHPFDVAPAADPVRDERLARIRARDPAAARSGAAPLPPPRAPARPRASSP
ncbi:MAG TPA: FAD-binding protein [Thermoleophilaceae bacterium]